MHKLPVSKIFKKTVLKHSGSLILFNTNWGVGHILIKVGLASEQIYKTLAEDYRFKWKGRMFLDHYSPQIKHTLSSCSNEMSAVFCTPLFGPYCLKITLLGLGLNTEEMKA